LQPVPISPSAAPVPHRAAASDALVDRLRLALDAGALQPILASGWVYLRQQKCRLLECRVERLHARGDKGYVVDYDMDLATPAGPKSIRVFGELPVSAADHAERILRNLRQPHRGQLAPDWATDAISDLPGTGLILRFPGLDEALPGMRLTQQPEMLLPAVAQGLDLSSQGVRVAALDVLSHRLGKRCVYRVRFARGADADPQWPDSIIVKLYKSRGDLGERVCGMMDTLWRRGFGEEGDVSVPRPIAYHPELRALLMQDIAAQSLHGLSGKAFMAGVDAAGRALAKLHESPVRVPNRYTAAEQIASLQEWTELASRVAPALAPAIARALERAGAAMADARPARSTLVHRDYHERQVLIRGPETVLIDFDTLCFGDPVIDVGNFIAHLRVASLRTQVPSRDLETLFLAAYGRARGEKLDGPIEPYVKAPLLRLACLNVFSTRWRRVAEQLLDAI
jgi:Phosphotransferase enzyme family